MHDFRLVVGRLDGLGVCDETGDAESSHIKPNHRFEVHVALAEGAYDCEAEVVGVGVGVVGGAVVESLHENQPLVLQVSLDRVVCIVVVTVVIEGAGVAGGVLDETSDVVVLSLQPNQPGVWHVDVDVLVVVVVLLGSSRHPHQPGVLHVSVRVLVYVLLGADTLVVVTDPSSSKNFQL